jgi:hypothetical protein
VPPRRRAFADSILHDYESVYSYRENAPGSQYPSVEASSEFLDTGRHSGTNLPSTSDLAEITGQSVLTNGIVNRSMQRG